MKKFDFVQISQLISNLAVVIGIVFLAVETREAGYATRLQTESARVEGYNAINLAVANNPDLARILVVGLDDPNRLENVEAAQFSGFMRAVMNQGGAMYAQYSLGLISDEVWQYSAQQIAQIFSTAGGKKYLQANSAAYANSSFLAALQPYMGQEMQSNFSLGRPPADF